MEPTASPTLLDLQQVVAGRYEVERELDRGGMGIVAPRDPARKAEARTALEAIRLDLLRLQAGQEVADHLTQDLGEARRLADRVDRALAADSSTG